MWKSYAIISTSICLLALASSSYAEDVLPPPLRCSKWVRFQVVLGRIHACQPHCQQCQRAERIDDKGNVCETLSVKSQHGVPSIKWQRNNTHEDFALTVDSGNVISITQRTSDDDVAIETQYIQPKVGPVQFLVTRSGKTTQRTAATLWHMLLTTPDRNRAELISLLDRLRPHWHLEAQSQRLNDQLFLVAAEQSRPDAEELRQLVRQLDSEQYQTRQRADRSLRKLGFSALPFLQQLDRRHLTSEQQLRVRRITTELRVESGDTPHRMAQWLSADKEIWLSMLSHDDAKYRKTAAIELSRLCDRPIDFDPMALDVERRLQIDRLSNLLATD